MTTDTKDLAEIAGGLSANMREAIEHSPWVDRIGLKMTTNRTWNGLEARGLTEPGRSNFTPLGLRLRDYLKEQSR